MLSCVWLIVAILAFQVPLGLLPLEPYRSWLALGPLGPEHQAAPGIMALAKASYTFKRTNTDNDDPVRAPKLANRFNDAMALALFPNPQRVDPRCIAIIQVNRLFSVQQLHRVILKSIFKDGHDPSRPAPGILCEVRDPAYVKKLIEHNEKLCATPLMPPLFPEHVEYESLASNHYNAVLRLGQACVHTPAGGLAKLKDEDEPWAQACTEGHLWIILPADLDETLKADISTRRNQDQNENQTITDGELVRLCKLAVDDFLVGAPGGRHVQLALQKLVTSTCNRTPVRITQ